MDPITFENALEKKCKNHYWMAGIFFLLSSPGILTAMQMASYVFLGGNPPFFCNVPELKEANWTNEQIKNISRLGSDKQSCGVYGWNYTSLKEMGFDEAVVYCNTTRKPDVINCKSYIYEEQTPHKTIVSQWDLVCENLPLRRIAEVGVPFGKLIGSFISGLLSDSFGRKNVFVSSCLLFIIASMAGAFMDDYTFFTSLRMLVGVANAGIYGAGYTILSEITVKKYRTQLGCLYPVPISLGYIFLPLAAYFTQNWRQLQLAISLPSVFLLFHCWYLPESPRWLITRGKLEKVSAIIGSDYCPDTKDLDQQENKEQSHNYCGKVFIILKSYFKLFSTLELTKRILICYFVKFVAYLNYFVILLNGTNFTVNEYMYVALNGIVEGPSHILPLLILTYFGRKSTGMALFTISGLSIIAIMAMPQGWPVMCMAMIGRLTIASVFPALSLLTSELIPTEYRNSAIGSATAVGQLGTMSAPYIVYQLGMKAWWIPSTIAGALSLVAAFFLVFVPETRDTTMLNTLKEMHQQEKKDHITDITSAS